MQSPSPHEAAARVKHMQQEFHSPGRTDAASGVRPGKVLKLRHPWPKVNSHIFWATGRTSFPEAGVSRGATHWQTACCEGLSVAH